MQATRQRILELLRDHQVMAVEELAGALDLTPVTVRHHLEVLKAEGLVEPSELRRRDSPGRPQHTFRLTSAAQAHFPKNYQGFAHLMVSEIREQLSESEMERILAGVASRMAAEAALPPADAPIEQRLDAAVRYLNARGYQASWERLSGKRVVLRTRNCPYHELSQANNEFCRLDLALVSRLLGLEPIVETRISSGETSCSYVLKA
ncbi:MAG: ArsR family transcriptional regulator [Anaerolineae bacterium]|nr:ArsR family transcriptional regulator [Thermoflexales bacterium]MDW8408886.1 ArsR family transcriptional regulator [Anaerolineae bacterium]